MHFHSKFSLTRTTRDRVVEALHTAFSSSEVHQITRWSCNVQTHNTKAAAIIALSVKVQNYSGNNFREQVIFFAYKSKLHIYTRIYCSKLRHGGEHEFTCSLCYIHDLSRVPCRDNICLLPDSSKFLALLILQSQKVEVTFFLS
jgi:hypothetical protein